MTRGGSAQACSSRRNVFRCGTTVRRWNTLAKDAKKSERNVLPLPGTNFSICVTLTGSSSVQKYSLLSPGAFPLSTHASVQAAGADFARTITLAAGTATLTFFPLFLRGKFRNGGAIFTRV